MYATLLVVHSLFRWLVVGSLALAIVRASLGYFQKLPFNKSDNALRHWTATTAHIQLVIGIILYIKSPIVQYFWANSGETAAQSELSFFGVIHFALMFTAVVLVTLGSALAKRQSADRTKYRTMLVWFTIAFLLIFIAIPWPFSPLANRPLFRTLP